MLRLNIDNLLELRSKFQYNLTDQRICLHSLEYQLAFPPEP
jgi:hypothetical protein